MYQIYDGMNLELNKVTPYTIKRYKALLENSSVKITKSIADVVAKELPNTLEEGNTLTESGVAELIQKVVRQEILDGLDIYLDKDFYVEWASLIFKINPEQIEKIKNEDFDSKDCKFSIDEFMRGFSDFFLRLKKPTG